MRPPPPPTETAGVYQARLAGHFKTLAAIRAGGQAVFALEHGLSEQEVEEVSDLVRTEASLPAGHRHWLLWIVHAAELGYDYDGDYWPRFVLGTRGWLDSNASRGWIREIFRRFAEDFGGPRPSGAWGATFMIIAWPITNALLPKDLQRQLARALYEVQSGLVGHLSNIGDLGQYIATNCWIRSDRFEQLTDQPILLGQIAMALLQPEVVGQETILRVTLDRIAGDLEHERQAATWLRSARATVERSHVRTAGRPFIGAPTLSTEERLEVAIRASAPELILTPRSSGEWTVRLRLPFVAPLLEISPEIRAQVAGSRAIVPAARNGRLATGQLLFPDQVVDLERWPRETDTLLRFEGVSRGLESALLRHWAMPPGPWLFRVRRNGIATEIRTRRIRPGVSYLIAVREEDAEVLSNLGLAPLRVECAGVLIARVDAPVYRNRDWMSALVREGFSPVRELTVWPAGQLPAEWDGDANIRWLSDDHPMLGLRTDHPVNGVLVSVDGRPVDEIQHMDDAEPRFVSLAGLGPGQHSLAVSYDQDDDETAVGMIAIEISEPRLNPEAATGPVVVWTEPFTRNLERLWDGQSVVRADGVDLEAVVCTLTLGSGPADQTVKSVHGVRLPLAGDEWRRLLRDSIQSDQRIRTKYPEAKWARLTLNAGGIGSYVLDFERELPPVRWLLSEEKDGYRLELRNDMDSNLPRELLYATFDRPDVWSSAPFDVDSLHFRPELSGGLHVARVGGRGSTIVVPPFDRRLGSFEGLTVSPTLSSPPRQLGALCELVETTRLWSSGRLTGDIRAQVWRSQIVRALQANLFSAICGEEWRANERNLQEQRTEDAHSALQNLVIRTPQDRRTVAGVLIAQRQEFSGMSNSERVERFAALARRANERVPSRWRALLANHGAATADWLAEFCLRAASDTHLDTWAGEHLSNAIAILLDWPLLGRTARCIVTASLVNSPYEEYPPLFPNWEWSLV